MMYPILSGKCFMRRCLTVRKASSWNPYLASGGRGRSTAVACQQLQHSLIVGGTGEKISLGHLVIELLKQFDVLFRLRPFGNYFQTEIVGKHNDDPHDLAALRIGVHVHNEGAIDFQRVHGNPAQTAKRRVPGAKIVDAKANPECLQLSEHLSRFLRIPHSDGFYDFELYATRVHAGLLESLANLAG